MEHLGAQYSAGQGSDQGGEKVPGLGRHSAGLGLQSILFYLALGSRR